MSKIVDYDLVSAHTAGDLMLKIRHAIKLGWQPIGGVAFKLVDKQSSAQVIYKQEDLYVQAIVLYEQQK